MRNVLVIMSDEHQRRALGSMVHPIVQTPNLDALAATGTTFTNCWTPSPICVPARGAFATGRWVHEIGTWDSAAAYAGEPEGWTHRWFIEPTIRTPIASVSASITTADRSPARLRSAPASGSTFGTRDSIRSCSTWSRILMSSGLRSVLGDALRRRGTGRAHNR